MYDLVIACIGFVFTRIFIRLSSLIVTSEVLITQRLDLRLDFS